MKLFRIVLWMLWLTLVHWLFPSESQAQPLPTVDYSFTDTVDTLKDDSLFWDTPADESDSVEYAAEPSESDSVPPFPNEVIPCRTLPLPDT